MASRSSANTPVIVSMALMGLLVVVLFVLSVVFFAKSQRLNTDLTAAKDNLRIAVREADMTDRWEQLKAEAARADMSVVRYLDQTRSQAIRAVTGSERDTPERMNERIQEIVTDPGRSLIAVISDRDAEIARLSSNLEEATRAQARAEESLRTSDEQIKTLRDEMSQTIASLLAEIEGYRANVQTNTDEVTGMKEWVDLRDQANQDEYLATITSLEAQANTLLDENQILQARVQELEAKNTTRLGPPGESTLIDARVVDVNAAGQSVYLDIGRQQHVVIGMTFEVYGNQVDLRPDANGEYPFGKGTVEVTSIEATSATARIIRENRGNPIVKGDVVANAIYDPSKVYSFVVFGTFDRNNDGVATVRERQDIESIIADWGGRVIADLDGSTDFLVLGQRPVLPPRPGPNDPVELTVRYTQAQREQIKYDELFETAKRTGIPVLNQNRLFTLTGLYARR